MMMKNKKVLLFTLFIILIIGITTVSAQDISEDTSILTDTQIQTNITDNSIVDNNIQTDTVKTTDNNKNLKSNSDDSIDITNDNYDNLNTYMSQYSTLNFVGDFNNKEIDITSPVTITGRDTTTFTNSNFIVNANGVTITNLKIENTITDETPVIYVNKKSNVNITNNDITLTKTNTGRTYAIELNQSSYSNIKLNNITVNAYPQNKDWIQQSIVSYIGVGKAAGVVVDHSNYVNVTENSITVTNSTVGGQAVSTFEAVAVRNDSTYVSVSNNNIDEDIYAVYLESSSTVQNNYLTSNYIKNDVSAQKTGDSSVYPQNTYSTVNNNYAYDLTTNNIQSSSKNMKSSGQKIYINDDNYANYLAVLEQGSGMVTCLLQNVEEGDYVNINISKGTEYKDYKGFTIVTMIPNITFFNIDNDFVYSILITSTATIENSTLYHLGLVSLSEDGSLDGISVNVKNSTIHSYDTSYGNYYKYGQYISFDNNSKLLATTTLDHVTSETVYGDQYIDDSSKPFESRIKNFYIRLLSKEYVEPTLSYDEYLNSLEDPILKTPANITGIRGAIYKEAQFTSKSSGSNITNVVFNNSTKINIKAKNIKFVNCTFNNELFIPEDHNITFENCAFSKEIQYVYEDDEPVTPPKTIILTKDNYNEYVTNRTLNDNVNEGDTIDMQGLFDSSLQGLTINKPVNIISSTHDANISLDSSYDTRVTGNKFTLTVDASGTNMTGITFYNTRVTIEAGDVSIDNITCDTYMAQIGQGVGSFSIRNSASNVNVTNSKFYTHGTFGHSTLVVAGASDVLIENNTIIGETDDDSPQLGKIGNLFYITTYGADGDNYNITVRGNTIDASKVLHDNEICNPVRIVGSKITIEDNIIISNDDAVLEQWMGSDEVTVDQLIFRNNTVTGRTGLFSTNVIIEDNILDSLIVSNSTIINNTIKDANIGNNSIIKNNTITQSITIADNTILEDNTITALLDISNSNITINNNNITNDEEYTIILNEGITDITITNNLLKSMDKTGDESIKNNSVEFTCSNNTYPTYNIKIDTTEFTTGTTATISASICFGEDVVSTLNKGKVTFKVNGKTLKDANGKVIYAKVVNGIAIIENYEIPESWNKKDSTIQAVYSGSVEVQKLTSDKENITITGENISIVTSSLTATAGSTVNLTASIQSTTSINNAKIVFKINGKSIKDENGKVIYAKVSNNTVCVEYTIPESMKVKDYNITAVLLSPDYERMEDTKVLSIA